MLVWELLGAAVGAGFASGREVASFFSQFGAWGTWGIVVATCTMAYLAQAQMPPAWRERWPALLWRILSALLLASTGGAMLAGAGEVAMLLVPWHGAYLTGMGLTLLLSWCLAKYTSGGLAGVSCLLIVVFAGMMAVAWRLPPMRATVLYEDSLPTALVRAMSYGGFNAALLPPVLAKSTKSDGERKWSVRAACALLAILLLLGHMILLRHPALLSEELPFVRLTSRLGQAGMVLSAASLYLAILSTLTACLRALEGQRLALAGLLAVSAAGFSGAVGNAYPLLGGACAVMLLLMRLRMAKSSRDRGNSASSR